MENASRSPIPQFSHDPGYISFRHWTAILSLKGTIPKESRRNDAVLYLNEVPSSRKEHLPVKGPVCLRNATRFTHLNVTIVNVRNGQKVFFARELPAGRFLHLEFLKEGVFTLHYSPAFSPVTLRRDIQVFAPALTTGSIPHNFHPRLQNALQTHLGGLSFNSPFPEYNGTRALRSLKGDLPTWNKEETAMNTKRKLHDGIVGAVLTAGSALAYYVDPLWILVPGVLGVTLLQSGLTGFCPLYFILDKTCKTA